MIKHKNNETWNQRIGTKDLGLGKRNGKAMEAGSELQTPHLP